MVKTHSQINIMSRKKKQVLNFFSTLGLIKNIKQNIRNQHLNLAPN